MEEKREVTNQETATGNVVTEKTTSQPNPEEKQAQAEEKSIFRAYYLVYYVTGLVEILLAFRFVFKVLGANPNSGFASLIYSLTDVFLKPFSGIFSSATSRGAETTSVFDPAILIAMVVYALIGWGVAKLIDVVTVGKTPAA
ncbi:MAG TPA: YggT family protein [Patescibacteria group bacterium]|nr:YggT family protein [Patescibacteria group bacterium]